jgi:hypothetical protein
MKLQLNSAPTTELNYSHIRMNFVHPNWWTKSGKIKKC